MTSDPLNEDRATTFDTIDSIAQVSRRHGSFPLRRDFIQQKEGRKAIAAPLANFVSAGDKTALLLYLLALTKASHEPWNVSLHSAVWARALGLPDPTETTARGRVSKAWTRLVERKLVARSRRNRQAEITLLMEDGSGKPYSPPKNHYIKIPLELWTDGPDPESRWYLDLSLPELSFLIIALSNLDQFALPVERGPDYYHISADTLLRGSQGLRRKQLLSTRRHSIKAPLAPEGFAFEHLYTLKAPFGPRGRTSIKKIFAR